MSWEPESLAHWNKCLEAEKARQANAQSDATDWTNRPLSREENNLLLRMQAHSRLDAHYARIGELVDIAIEMENEA